MDRLPFESGAKSATEKGKMSKITFYPIVTDTGAGMRRGTAYEDEISQGVEDRRSGL
jgi:hypothetical protein